MARGGIAAASRVPVAECTIQKLDDLLVANGETKLRKMVARKIAEQARRGREARTAVLCRVVRRLLERYCRLSAHGEGVIE